MERIIDDRYLIERQLGAGAMGSVLQVFDTQLKRRLALKLLHSQTEESLIRFRREARAAARLQSEHVVRIMDARVTAEGDAYIVMERLVGQDLHELLCQHGPLPPLLAAEYVAQACDALDEAHKQGIIHRDIKPSNLFLADRHDGTKILKVLDFGISKASVEDDVAGAQTAEFAIIGTPRYIAPERLQLSKNVDGRSDIWALGAVLYELLTGEPAFPAESGASLIAQIVATDAPEVRCKRPEVPQALNDIIAQCLRRDPVRRYASAAELKHALTSCTTAQPAPAEPMTSESTGTPDLTIGTTNRVHVVDPPTPRASGGLGLRVLLLATGSAAVGVSCWRLLTTPGEPSQAAMSDVARRPAAVASVAPEPEPESEQQHGRSSAAPAATPSSSERTVTEPPAERVIYDVDSLPLVNAESVTDVPAGRPKRSVPSGEPARPKRVIRRTTPVPPRARRSIPPARSSNGGLFDDIE